MSLRSPAPSSLYGLVDMGSNGIRFSITDLSPSTARCLPTIYTDREGISLYDAQYSTSSNSSSTSGGSGAGVKGPIPQEVIDDVLRSLLKFKTVCADFGVPETNIRILATEATRSAVNSEDFRRQILEGTQWEVDMLPKEAEGRIGAMGIASSFREVEGLVMDLGGGSTQITWMISRADSSSSIKTSPKGSISFPYGAAAMTRLLADLEKQQPNKNKSGLHLFKSKSPTTSSLSSASSTTPAGPAASTKEELEETMKTQFRQAYADLHHDMPESLRHKAKHGGLTLYLSGGGFRGWGYLLMSQHRTHPYPIPIINGFSAGKREFQQTKEMGIVAAEESVFRISKRRAAQVPAVAFLVNVLIDALPMISTVRFCQGGVREGFFFDSLPQEVRAQDPLTAATAQFGSEINAEEIGEILWNAMPGENSLGREIPATISKGLVRAVTDLMYMGGVVGNKESRAVVALGVPITGVLAGVHGVSHCERAVLALALCTRWGGDLPPPYADLERRLKGLLTNQEVWWAGYLGRVAALVGEVYPAGRIRESMKKRLELKAYWADGLGKKGMSQGVVLEVKCRREEGRDVLTTPAVLHPLVEALEKLGKKKNKVGGEHGFGVPVDVRIARVLP